AEDTHNERISRLDALEKEQRARALRRIVEARKSFVDHQSNATKLHALSLAKVVGANRKDFESRLDTKTIDTQFKEVENEWLARREEMISAREELTRLDHSRAERLVRNARYVGIPADAVSRDGGREDADLDERVKGPGDSVNAPETERLRAARRDGFRDPSMSPTRIRPRAWSPELVEERRHRRAEEMRFAEVSEDEAPSPVRSDRRFFDDLANELMAMLGYRKNSLSSFAGLTSDKPALPFAVNTTKAIFKMWSKTKKTSGRRKFPLCIDCRKAMFIHAPKEDDVASKEGSINSTSTMVDAETSEILDHFHHTNGEAGQCACCTNLTTDVVELDDDDESPVGDEAESSLEVVPEEAVQVPLLSCASSVPDMAHVAGLDLGAESVSAINTPVQIPSVADMIEVAEEKQVVKPDSSDATPAIPAATSPASPSSSNDIPSVESLKLERAAPLLCSNEPTQVSAASAPVAAAAEPIASVDAVVVPAVEVIAVSSTVVPASSVPVALAPVAPVVEVSSPTVVTRSIEQLVASIVAPADEAVKSASPAVPASPVAPASPVLVARDPVVPVVEEVAVPVTRSVEQVVASVESIVVPAEEAVKAVSPVVPASPVAPASPVLAALASVEAVVEEVAVPVTRSVEQLIASVEPIVVSAEETIKAASPVVFASPVVPASPVLAAIAPVEAVVEEVPVSGTRSVEQAVASVESIVVPAEKAVKSSSPVAPASPVLAALAPVEEVKASSPTVVTRSVEQLVASVESIVVPVEEAVKAVAPAVSASPVVPASPVPVALAPVEAVVEEVAVSVTRSVEQVVASVESIVVPAEEAVKSASPAVPASPVTPASPVPVALAPVEAVVKEAEVSSPMNATRSVGQPRVLIKEEVAAVVVPPVEEATQSPSVPVSIVAPAIPILATTTVAPTVESQKLPSPVTPSCPVPANAPIATSTARETKQPTVSASSPVEEWQFLICSDAPKSVAPVSAPSVPSPAPVSPIASLSALIVDTSFSTETVSKRVSNPASQEPSPSSLIEQLEVPQEPLPVVPVFSKEDAIVATKESAPQTVTIEQPVALSMEIAPPAVDLAPKLSIDIPEKQQQLPVQQQKPEPAPQAAKKSSFFCCF
ncbi:hypothetical protein HDU98_001004, partial [Podochytrium sp. JEL0797]